MSDNIWVVITNRAEYCYMIAWCEDNNMGTPINSCVMIVPKFPVAIVICKDDGMAGWNDCMDRAANYIDFKSFVANHA